jgi:group I intron endonuclease
MKLHGIYKITNPENKIYIGKSLDIEYRFKQYKNLSCKEQPLILESLKKYGWFNHIFEIIEICDEKNINEKEKYWINYFNCNDNGLNCFLNPNTSWKYPEEAKKIKSKQMKTLWMEGKHSGRGKKPIINLQNNKQYNSIKEACIDMKISFTKAYKYLGEGKILSYINIKYG